jgi:hypothetical protein
VRTLSKFEYLQNLENLVQGLGENGGELVMLLVIQCSAHPPSSGLFLLQSLALLGLSIPISTPTLSEAINVNSAHVIQRGPVRVLWTLIPVRYRRKCPALLRSGAMNSTLYLATSPAAQSLYVCKMKPNGAQRRDEKMHMKIDGVGQGDPKSFVPIMGP